MIMRKCRHCRSPLEPRKGEHPVVYANRQFCSVRCIIANARAQGFSTALTPALGQALATAQQLAHEALERSKA